MSEVVAIVEGQTEQAFIHDHLAKYLARRGITIWASLPGREVRSGGVRAWESVRGDVLRTLQERRGRVCTTMFDFYAMPNDWPGRARASEMPQGRKGDYVERALLDDLAAFAGEDFRRDLFIPYVQMHEFEALLFTDVGAMGEVLGPIQGVEAPTLTALFQAVLDQAGPPETINDHWMTCPSRRITSIVPDYRKPSHGPLIADKIGLDVLRAACPHFGQWLGRLESLGTAAAAG